MTRQGGALRQHLPVLAFAVLLPVVQRHHARPTFPATLCSTPLSGDARPSSAVSILRSEAVGDGSELRITTLLVHFPPHAFTPRHIHGGALTAYVLSGRVRSQLDAGSIAELRPGDTFHEAVGTTHAFIENQDDQPADVLATIVHAPGAALTTMTP